MSANNTADASKPTSMPIRGIQSTPMMDHVDGLRAALLELAERCGEVRRIVDARFRRSAATDMLRQRLMTIAEVAMKASQSTGASAEGISGDDSVRLIWDRELGDQGEPDFNELATWIANSGAFLRQRYRYTVHVIPHEISA